MAKLSKMPMFTSRQRAGIITLLALIVIVLLIDLSLDKIFPPKYDFDHTQFQAQVDSFINSLEPKNNQTYYNKLDSFIIAKYDTIKLFPFDPNTTTDEEWKKLGLTNKQIRTINNYKQNGGKFVVKDDFRKIYGIRYMQYQILEPYIQLPDKRPPKSNVQPRTNFPTQPQKTKFITFDPNTATAEELKQAGLNENQINEIISYRQKRKFTKKYTLKQLPSIDDSTFSAILPLIKFTTDPLAGVSIEINSATPEDLMMLPGIGPKMAGKIIKYRNKLGGFYSINQVAETYGLKPEVFQKIKQYLTVNQKTIKKININLADFKTLISHPYLNKEETKAILNYRSKNGFYTSVNQLKTEKILSEERFEKVKNYLSVN